jgi:hypothetical protein
VTAIYHITHIDNLPHILGAGGLWCDRLRLQHSQVIVSIAHQHIKDRRAQRPVPVSAGGTLADYVPFYFAPRSPMLFAIHRGNVDDYHGGQEQILHLVTTVQMATQCGRPWAFTEGHADIAYSEFFDDLADLNQIDWNIMSASYWAGSDEDKRHRQAEFLVHQFFPWASFTEIGVCNSSMVARVQARLAPAAHRPPVHVRSGWYY